MRIPTEINQWDKSQTVDYYIDNLKWTLVPLKQGTKEHLYNEAKAMRLKPEELRKDLGNGSNIGLYPGGDLVAIDLGLDMVGQRQFQFAQLALRGQDTAGDRHLDARRNLHRIFANA